MAIAVGGCYVGGKDAGGGGKDAGDGENPSDASPVASPLLVASRAPGGLTSLRWRGIELGTGGVYYLIASCTGSDDRLSNIDSNHGPGFMQTADGQRPCGNVPFHISFSGDNPIRADITIGPMEQQMGAVSFALDLDKTLFSDFRWSRPEDGWWEGCANDWTFVSGRAGGPVAGIRAPCKIYDGATEVGSVGIAHRAITGLQSLTLIGPFASVLRETRSVAMTDPGAAAIPIVFSTDAASLGLKLVEGSAGFVNHPGTNGLGGDIYNVPAGATIHLVEEVSVQDPPIVAVACGGLPAGGFLRRGEYVNSCDDKFTLAHQLDGNVVFYRRADARALWSTGTADRATSVLAMQNDGNLVLYSADNTPLWATGTGDHPDAYLLVQGDGKIVIYTSADWPLWSIP